MPNGAAADLAAGVADGASAAEVTPHRASAAAVLEGAVSPAGVSPADGVSRAAGLAGAMPAAGRSAADSEEDTGTADMAATAFVDTAGAVGVTGSASIIPGGIGRATVTTTTDTIPTTTAATAMLRITAHRS